MKTDWSTDTLAWMATKTEYIACVHSELEDPLVPKTMIKAFLEAQRRVLVKLLRKDKRVTIPNVVKITLRMVPPKPERNARNPANGRPMVVAAKPATKKFRAIFLTDFKIGVGILESKSVQKSLERRAMAEPLRTKRKLQVKALSKLTREELDALGLSEMKLPKRSGRHPKTPTIEDPKAGTRPITPQVAKPLPLEPVDESPQVLLDRIVYVLGRDTLKFEDICNRLQVFGWMPKRKSSVSNVLSRRKDVFDSPARGVHQVALRVLGPEKRLVR